MKTNNTDQKLLFLLESGEMFRNLLDPDGITGAARVERIFHSKPTEEVSNMMVTLRFKTGQQMLVSCLSDPEGIVVKGIRTPVESRGIVEIPSLPEKTLLSAIKDLSGIPVGLKASLVPVPSKITRGLKDTAKLVKSYYALENNALFWGVEGMSKDDRGESRFEDYSAKFNYNEEGSLVDVELATKAPLDEGKILLITRVNVFGIGSKKVILERNLGMGRGFMAECKIVKDGKSIPSLKVAFDLDKRLDTFYTKQRRKKKNMGKPKAK